MNIYAKNGDKVIFVNDTSGYDHDQLLAKQYLEKGKVYTIDFTDVGGWHTSVYLKEIPGRSFNSVLFEDYVEQYAVKIKGCDDHNSFVMKLTEDELAFLEKLSKLSIEKSNYSCMPTIHFRLATVEDLEDLEDIDE